MEPQTPNPVSPPAPPRHKLQATLFLPVVMLALLAGFALNMRKTGIFACPAAYEHNQYLAYCNGASYGEYDHAAFWYDMQPEATQAAAKADVMFLGNSRMEFGFSTPLMDQWFQDHHASFYLLGFSLWENVTFEEPLVKKLTPKARAYVINVDNYFAETESVPGGDLLHNRQPRPHFDAKHRWQYFHREICSHAPQMCGTEPATYRRRDTGAWTMVGVGIMTPGPVGAELPVDSEKVAMAARVAPSFIQSLGVPRECVLLTYVPTGQYDVATAREIANALGLKLYSPTLEGLQTYDGAHLALQSADRYTKAFLEQAGPAIESCVQGHAL